MKSWLHLNICTSGDVTSSAVQAKFDYSYAKIWSSSVPSTHICNLNNKVIWHNATPSSSQLSCPLVTGFVQETSDVTNLVHTLYKETFV